MASEKDKEAEIDFDAIRNAIRKELEEPKQRKMRQLEAGKANLKKLRDYIASRLKDPKVVKEVYGYGDAKFEVCYHKDGNMCVGFGFVASDERNNPPKYQLYLPTFEPSDDDYYPVSVTAFLDFEKLVKAVLRELSEDLN